MTKEEKLALVKSVPFWWHEIDLGDGVVTPGKYPSRYLETLVKEFPDLEGKSVLDIGAWDGYYSFRAEELGAARVLAVDKPIWTSTLTPDWKYKDIINNNGSDLQGKRGFDIAHALKGSKVESLVSEIMELSSDRIGTFDVVLFLDVWYHLEDPWTSIKKLSELANETVVASTHAIFTKGLEDRALLEFFDGDLYDDPSNWFAFNLKSINKMFKTAGFRKIEVKSKYPPEDKDRYYKLIFHALK
jgi:tRNA (mo5U34)-methyltransferase